MNQKEILIHNAHIYTEKRDWLPGWIVISGTNIRLMGAGSLPDFPPDQFTKIIDAKGKTLLPGFIDPHAHGAVGQEAMDANPDGLRKMAEYYAQHGVTSFVPTTWTAKVDAVNKVLDCISKNIGPVKNGAKILGVHLEGPYLNSLRCGAQDASLIHLADKMEVIQFLESGIVRLIAVAPEFSENLWLVDECVRSGITVSIGHSAANYEQVRIAVQHGATHATHTFNAMTPLGHRELGTVGAVMASPEINCELISDNIHVHPAAQKILIDTKGTDSVILVTDSIRGTGLPDGDYPIDNRTITIKDGAARLPDGSLAGSTLTMERALRNSLIASGRMLKEIWPMSSLNAARDLGIAASKGSLEIGKDADLVLLSEEFEVIMTIAEGTIVYDREVKIKG
jgi:N-acetylglucosamine-6-phosphate deacetylase